MKYWNIKCFCFYKKSAQEIIEQNNYVKMKKFNWKLLHGVSC